MNALKRYVLMLDSSRDFIRVFRSDCPMRPDGTPLWEGDGLKRAYEEMKRLNKERAATVIYSLCRKVNSQGNTSFRVYRVSVPAEWSRFSNHLIYSEAVSARKRAVAAEAERRRNERHERKERAEKDRLMKRSANDALLKTLRSVGVNTKRVPKLTDKDRRYLEWIEQRRKLIAEAA